MYVQMRLAITGGLNYFLTPFRADDNQGRLTIDYIRYAYRKNAVFPISIT